MSDDALTLQDAEEVAAAIRLYADEPAPELRCTAAGCLWRVDFEPDDWNDRAASSWYRAERHAEETGHTIRLFMHPDETEPFGMYGPYGDWSVTIP